MRLILILLLVLWAAPADAANLCVKVGGSDATAKASIVYVAGNEAGSTCWATIGRAMWGSTNRAAPNAGEAGTAGDTVFVFGGSYNSTLALNDEFTVLYQPVNDGTLGSPLRLTCVGTCVVTCPVCASPALGTNGTADYFEVFADVLLGHAWSITACLEDSAAPVRCPASGVLATSSDTGAVLCGGLGQRIEGVQVTGNAPTEVVNENWPGIGLHGCIDGVVKNNWIRDMLTSPDPDGHSTCFVSYNTHTTTVENNRCEDSDSFFAFKDNGGFDQEGNVVRYNYVEDIYQCNGYSLQGAGTEDRNYVYQNVLVRCGFGVNLTYAVNDWFYNNTIVSPTDRGINYGGVPTGFRFWNNIITGGVNPIYSEGAFTNDTGVISFQHNLYDAFSGNFLQSETSPNQATLANFQAAWTNQETADPDGIDSDPRFANAAGGDYRLCTGAGAPHASCVGASPAINLGINPNTSAATNAGAYITNSECIGLESGCTAAAPGPIRIRRSGE